MVGTLNSRESYDRNLYQDYYGEQIFARGADGIRLEAIFDVRNGPMFEDRTATRLRPR